MNVESGSSSVVFINTDTAVFSKTSRRTARSHAASVSRSRQKAAELRAKSRRDDRFIGGGFSGSYESTVSSPAKFDLSLMIRGSPDAVTPIENQSPRTLLDSSLFDPFATTVLPLDRKMSGLLHGCSFFYGRRSYPVKSMTDAFNDWTLPLVLRDPVLFNATMCMAAAEVEVRNGTIPIHRSVSGTAVKLANNGLVASNYIYFKVQTIKQLNRMLSNLKPRKLSTPTICAIMFLLCAEWHCGNHEDIRAHTSGLQQAIEAAGGLYAFPLPVVLTIMWVVNVCSAMIHTRPPFRPPTLSIQRVSKSTRDTIDRCPDHVLNQTATGFCTPANRRLLNPAIMKAIARIRTYIQFRKLSCGGAIQTSPREFEFFYMRHSSVEHDLLSMPFDELLSPLTPLQNAVRLVLFIFGFATYTRFEPSSAYVQAIVAQLKGSLELVDSAATGTLDLHMWTQFFAAHISRQNKARPWFIMCLARTIRQLQLRSVDDMQDILVRFFFLEGFTRQSLLEIWDEVSSVA